MIAYAVEYVLFLVNQKVMALVYSIRVCLKYKDTSGLRGMGHW